MQREASTRWHPPSEWNAGRGPERILLARDGAGSDGRGGGMFESFRHLEEAMARAKLESLQTLHDRHHDSGANGKILNDAGGDERAVPRHQDMDESLRNLEEAVRRAEGGASRGEDEWDEEGIDEAMAQAMQNSLNDLGYHPASSSNCNNGSHEGRASERRSDDTRDEEGNGLETRTSSRRRSRRSDGGDWTRRSLTDMLDAKETRRQSLRGSDGDLSSDRGEPQVPAKAGVEHVAGPAPNLNRGARRRAERRLARERREAAASFAEGSGRRASSGSARRSSSGSASFTEGSASNKSLTAGSDAARRASSGARRSSGSASFTEGSSGNGGLELDDAGQGDEGIKNGRAQRRSGRGGSFTSGLEAARRASGSEGARRASAGSSTSRRSSGASSFTEDSRRSDRGNEDEAPPRKGGKKGVLKTMFGWEEIEE